MLRWTVNRLADYNRALWSIVRLVPVIKVLSWLSIVLVGVVLLEQSAYLSFIKILSYRNMSTGDANTMLHEPHVRVVDGASRSWTWPKDYQLGSRRLTRQHAGQQAIPELVGGRRPASYGCRREPDDPLLFLGIFTTASRSGRRNLLRAYEKPKSTTVSGSVVEFKFIIGRPEDATEWVHAFFRWLATRPGPKPRFAFKADDDALVAIPKMVELLRNLNCSDLYYIGACCDPTPFLLTISCGVYRGLPAFFAGMSYGLSAPVYQWLGNAGLPANVVRGDEDVRTAEYMLNLDEARGEKLIRLRLDDRMKGWRDRASWREWDFDPETALVLHDMKEDDELKRIRDKMRLNYALRISLSHLLCPHESGK